LIPICTKSFVGLGLAPDPLGELTALPQTPRGSTSEGRGGEGERRGERRGETGQKGNRR